MDYDEDIITVLTTDECWDALRRHEFGRLAYVLGGEVSIAPVNYAVDGETLLFTTAEGSKLLGVLMNPDVVFEIDGYDDELAHSVIVRGRASLLSEDQEHRIENVDLRPWLDTLKYNVVEVTPTRITGRSFRLSDSGGTRREPRPL
jgi:nitroimidazol reductase NimA-like FMN-containing flavoprotein (pyridoxamine 5'-phosphate oxidase superfamily)